MVGRKYPAVHFTEKNYLFKPGSSFPRIAPAVSVHDNQVHYQHHLEGGQDDVPYVVLPSTFDQREEVTSDYEESILSQPAAGADGKQKI